MDHVEQQCSVMKVTPRPAPPPDLCIANTKSDDHRTLATLRTFRHQNLFNAMKYTILFTVIGVLLGALGGWLYWSNFGCTTGCSITSSPVNSSLYGAFMGGLLVNTFKRDRKDPVQDNNTTEN
ncbi:MAG: hypothetical protein WEC15_03315 [Flavobacteriales bacterium]